MSEQAVGRRWDVELPGGDLNDVGAYELEIEAGSLVFRDESGFLVIAYGPGAWRTVVPQ